MSDYPCPHEGDIEYGKTIVLEDGKYHICNILCSDCGMVGTQLEERDEDDHDHYLMVDEVWHEARDYYNDTIASHKTIGMQDK